MLSDAERASLESAEALIRADPAADLYCRIEMAGLMHDDCTAPWIVVYRLMDDGNATLAWFRDASKPFQPG